MRKEGGRRKENEERRNEEGGRRTMEGGQRKEDKGRRTKEGGQRKEDKGRRLEIFLQIFGQTSIKKIIILNSRSLFCCENFGIFKLFSIDS